MSGINTDDIIREEYYEEVPFTEEEKKQMEEEKAKEKGYEKIDYSKFPAHK